MGVLHSKNRKERGKTAVSIVAYVCVERAVRFAESGLQLETNRRQLGKFRERRL